MTTYDQETGPEREAAARHEIQKVIAQFGQDTVRRVFQDIERGQGAGSGEAAPEQMEKEPAEIIRLREILSRPDLKYYLQLNFRTGEEFLGRRFERDGYDHMVSDPKYFEQYSGRGGPGFFDRVIHRLEDVESSFEQQDPEERLRRLSALLVSNVDGAGSTALALELHPLRPDSWERQGSGYTVVFLSQAEAEEVVPILAKHPKKTLEVVLSRLDPRLPETFETSPELVLKQGRITLKPGEDWRYTANNKIEFYNDA